MFASVRFGGRGALGAVVVGQFKGAGLDAASAGLDASGLAASVAKAGAAGRGEATGDVGRTVVLPSASGPRVVIVGLGPREGFTLGALRDAMGGLIRSLAAAKVSSVELAIDHALATLEERPAKAEAGRCLGEGVGLASWVCDQFRGTATPDPARAELRVTVADSATAEGVRRGLALAEASNLARTLSNTPPNICTPAYMAEVSRRVAKKFGLRCTVMEGEALERERFVGLVNVGKASENAPCMIRLEYRPARPRRGAKPVVLIGKTMTYDSGGLSIKVNNGMKNMKRDKDGGCAVLGAMQAVASVIRPGVPVVALLAAAENSISDEAYRPDDIITYRNGVTVEVTNTDAEGRLVLADALCWACEKENPGAIIDMATLTGGVVIALGHVFAGMWCDDDRLRGAIEAAAESTGERVWRLPHDPAYREMMKSVIADIHNSAPVREAHPIQGAAFLSYFCEAGVPWAHLDIAGVHETEKTRGPFEAGPTGWGARLAAEAVARYAGA